MKLYFNIAFVFKSKNNPLLCKLAKQSVNLYSKLKLDMMLV